MSARLIRIAQVLPNVEVTLAEAGTRLGGRLLHEATRPGLASWMRVADHRVHALKRMGNVTIALQSELGADDVLAFGADHVFIATGARWRRHGLGRQHRAPVVGADLPRVFTPDDVFAGAKLASPVAIYDDDHYVPAARSPSSSRAPGTRCTSSRRRPRSRSRPSRRWSNRASRRG